MVKATGSKSLTYLQRKAARAVALGKRHAINEDVDLVLSYLDMEAKQLSMKHKRSVPWFLHQFYQGGRVVCQRQCMNLFNAATQINTFLQGCKGGM